MSDQPKETSPKKRAVRIREPHRTDGPAAPEPRSARIDSAATAALALAVTSAETATSPRTRDGQRDGQRDGPAPAVAAIRPAGAANANVPKRHLISAATVLLSLLGGWYGAQLVSDTTRSDPRRSEAAAALRENRDSLAGLTNDVQSLKIALASLRESVERSRSDATAEQGHLVERLDSGERVARETAAGLHQLRPLLDRIETAAKDPGVKLTALGERLERIERQIAAGAALKAAVAPAAPPVSATPVPAAPAPGQDPSSRTGSVEPKGRDLPVDGWVLHEVYNGVALIESRNRRLVEVGPGEMVPGVGRVEAIEKRGRRWVVVTAKGVIGSVQ
jgi:hypothetical protein